MAILKKGLIVFIIILLLQISETAYAQWQTQTITLNPGWNAVFLEVQPQTDDTELVFQGIPVESIWTWNRQVTIDEFVSDVNQLIPEQPEWLTFFPAGSKKEHLNNLHAIQAGRGYLVKLSGTASLDISITGRPVARLPVWKNDSFNLVGFHIDPASPPTFADFFSDSPAHTGKPVFKLDSTGQWQAIENPAAEQIQAGTAYWVYCEGASQFSGPLSISYDFGDGIDFGRSLNEYKLRIRNNTTDINQITVMPAPSAAPPDLSLPPVAGQVQLSYWQYILSENLLGNWTDLASPAGFALEPGQELVLRLSVNRADMGLAAPGSLFQGLLKITDNHGNLFTLPVTADGISTAEAMSAKSSSAFAAGSTDGHFRAGLWVGTAAVEKVAYPAGSDNYVKAEWPFPIRLIVHVDNSGQARLLQQAILLWIPEVLGEQGIPGRLVILTSDDTTDTTVLGLLQDVQYDGNQPLTRRITSTSFSFKTPVELGSLGADFSSLSGVISLPFDDPLNPFFHRFHPDHDNLDFSFDPLPAGYESYDITRTIRLAFSTTDPLNLQEPGYGDNKVGGTYEEDIGGLNKVAAMLKVRGTFRLQKVAHTGVLNDGQVLADVQ